MRHCSVRFIDKFLDTGCQCHCANTSISGRPMQFQLCRAKVMPPSSGVEYGTTGEKGARIGPHYSIQSRAPKNLIWHCVEHDANCWISLNSFLKRSGYVYAPGVAISRTLGLRTACYWLKAGRRSAPRDRYTAICYCASIRC